MDIRKIPIFAEISKPSEEVIKLIYAEDLAAFKAIDSLGNEILFPSSGLPYTSCVVLVSQAGVAEPTQKILYNNIPNSNPEWLYNDVGEYLFEINVAGIDDNKVSFIIGNPADITTHIAVERGDITSVVIFTTDLTNQVAQNNVLQDVYVEMRIYN